MSSETSKTSADELAKKLAKMDRDRLIKKLRSLCCSFQLDFTDDFLTGISLERLRHITLAATMQSFQCSGHRPDSHPT